MLVILTQNQGPIGNSARLEWKAQTDRHHHLKGSGRIEGGLRAQDSACGIGGIKGKSPFGAESREPQSFAQGCHLL
jgi:hypothetical protein